MSSRQKILVAARDSFYRSGYQATSVDTLLQQTGVSKSNFYYHFRSKEDLAIAVLELRQSDFRALLDATLRQPGKPPGQRLEAFLSCMVQTQDALLHRGGCPFGNLVAEMADHSERLRHHLSAVFAELVDEVAAVVDEGQRTGDIRPDADARAIAELFVQATQGLHLMAKCHKAVADHADGVRLLMRLISMESAATPAAEFAARAA